MITFENIVSFGVGVASIIFICVIVSIISKFRNKKYYMLPELQSMVVNIHKNLNEANKNCIKLTEAFNEIGKTNER